MGMFMRGCEKMPCEYCLRYDGHDKRCPNYSSTDTGYVCSVCDENIEPYEEYVENNDNEKAHWECVSTAYELAEFLGCKIKEMEDYYYD